MLFNYHTNVWHERGQILPSHKLGRDQQVNYSSFCTILAAQLLQTLYWTAASRKGALISSQIWTFITLRCSFINITILGISPPVQQFASWKVHLPLPPHHQNHQSNHHHRHHHLHHHPHHDQSFFLYLHRHHQWPAINSKETSWSWNFTSTWLRNLSLLVLTMLTKKAKQEIDY